MAGTNFYYKNTDTINTSHRDLGVIPVVLAQEKLIDAKYRVIFTGGTMPNVSYDLFRSFNNFVTYDTLKKNLSTTMTGLALDDSSRIFDGILFKVPGIRSGTLNPASNNIGVIKDPGTNTADTLQTRYQGWDYKGNRNLTGSAYKQNSTRPFQSVSMSLSYPMQGTYTNRLIIQRRFFKECKNCLYRIRKRFAGISLSGNNSSKLFLSGYEGSSVQGL
jgi:hypothetical protein